jgi:large subunit ribosomal protein L19e
MIEGQTMILKLQKRLAATVLNCSPKRVVFDPARLEDIKEAITKTDIRLLVGEGAISERPERGVSRFRANKRKRQKSKGLRKGEGSRKGKATARRPKKQAWMDRIRAQRKFLKYLKENSLLKPGAFKELYVKSKGGFFRSIKHIKLHIHEHELMLNPEKDNKQAPVKKEQNIRGVNEKQEKIGKTKSKQPSKNEKV